MINDYKSKGEWKIQLTAEINFTSLKPDSDETRIMHTKGDNKEIMIGSDTNEVIKELFKSFLQRYQDSLQEFVIYTLRQVIRCLHIVHLIKQKINLIIIEVIIAWKTFVKT